MPPEEFSQPKPIQVDRIMPAVSMLIEEFSQNGLKFPDRLIQLVFLTQDGHHSLPPMVLVQDSDDPAVLTKKVNRLQYWEKNDNLTVVIKNETGEPVTMVTKDSQRLVGATTTADGFFVEVRIEKGEWQFLPVQKLESAEGGEIVLFLDPPTNPQAEMPELRGMRVRENLIDPLRQIKTELVGVMTFDPSLKLPPDGDDAEAH